MLCAQFRFYGNLNDFLPPEYRQVWFERRLKEQSSVKDTLEAIGVPHPEIGLILVNGDSVSFRYLMQGGDRVSVYPQFAQLDITPISQVQPPPLAQIRFVLDVHLGKLATWLRLLGFDALYRNDYEDEELAAIASQKQRVLLTQDRGLLKRSIVTYGYAVRSDQPEVQVTEVLERFDLYGAIAPMQRCPRCNGLLEAVEKSAVADQLPHYTRLFYNDFSQCRDCQQIYWKGAHYDRIQQFINRAMNSLSD